MLQSPYFLYRSELGTQAGGTFTLTPFEVATELAYLLTGTTPDDTLLAAADYGRRRQPDADGDGRPAGDAPARHVEREQRDRGDGVHDRLARPRSPLHDRPRRHRLHDVEVGARRHGAGDAEPASSRRSTAAAAWRSVLTADHTFLNSELATFYGLPDDRPQHRVQERVAAPVDGARSGPAGERDDPERLRAARHVVAHAARPHGALAHALPGRQRRRRRTWTRPSTRRRRRRRRASTSRTARRAPATRCHKYMDWIGFGFENYDGWGRHRTTENGMPIDSSVTVYSDPQGEGRVPHRADGQRTAWRRTWPRATT